MSGCTVLSYFLRNPEGLPVFSGICSMRYCSDESCPSPRASASSHSTELEMTQQARMVEGVSDKHQEKRKNDWPLGSANSYCPFGSWLDTQPGKTSDISLWTSKRLTTGTRMGHYLSHQIKPLCMKSCIPLGIVKAN